MPQRRKLSDKRVLEIFDAPGTHTSIARRYRVSPTTVGNIKTGRRKPRSAKPPKVKQEVFRTPVGEVVKAQVVAMKHGRYMILVRFPARSAKPLIEKIRRVQAARLREVEDKPWAMESEFEPFKKESDGSYVFTFKTGEYFYDQLRLTNVAGNKLRKPQLISAGRKVVISYRPIAWDRARWHKRQDEQEVRFPGVGVILALVAVTLLREKRVNSLPDNELTAS
jgi:hypothetical protein